MATALILTPRDEALLSLLARTPATTAMLLTAAETFPADPFLNERRLRERLHTLAQAKLVRAYSLAVIGGGLMNYYTLAPEGFVAIHPQSASPPHSLFAAIAPSRLRHTLDLADVIIHTLVACHRARVAVNQFHREGELTLATGEHAQQPDGTFQLLSGGRVFNVLFEIDESTESVDSNAEQSLKHKLLGYEAYQDLVWQQWKAAGKDGPRPYFKVAFLTRSTLRAYHLLSLAKSLARNPDRCLCFAATREDYLGSPRAVLDPLFLDHHGGWRALVNPHPSAPFMRERVRIPDHVTGAGVFC